MTKVRRWTVDLCLLWKTLLGRQQEIKCFLWRKGRFHSRTCFLGGFFWMIVGLWSRFFQFIWTIHSIFPCFKLKKFVVFRQQYQLFSGKWKGPHLEEFLMTVSRSFLWNIVTLSPIRLFIMASSSISVFSYQLEFQFFMAFNIFHPKL